MNWAYAFAIASCAFFVCFAIALVNIYSQPEETPQVACIKQRGKWESGYGRSGWSGMCAFECNAK